MLNIIEETVATGHILKPKSQGLYLLYKQDLALIYILSEIIYFTFKFHISTIYSQGCIL